MAMVLHQSLNSSKRSIQVHLRLCLTAKMESERTPLTTKATKKTICLKPTIGCSVEVYAGGGQKSDSRKLSRCAAIPDFSGDRSTGVRSGVKLGKLLVTFCRVGVSVSGCEFMAS